jgi:hypothetical protein
MKKGWVCCKNGLGVQVMTRHIHSSSLSILPVKSHGSSENQRKLHLADAGLAEKGRSNRNRTQAGYPHGPGVLIPWGLSLEIVMDTEKTHRRAYEKWEAEGRPEGEHDRHWREAEQEESGDGDLPQTSSPAHHSATKVPEKGRRKTSSNAIPSKGGTPGDFKPGELASENK